MITPISDTIKGTNLLNISKSHYYEFWCDWEHFRYLYSFIKVVISKNFALHTDFHFRLIAHKEGSFLQ